jgi:TPR repeat protein
MLTKNSRGCTRNVTGPASGFAIAALWTLSSLACAQQQQSAALPATAEMQWNRELLSSGRIEQLAGSMAQANKAAQESVDDSMIARFKNTLPSIEQLGSTLKYGNAVVVSSQGPEVIGLIRAVAMRKGKERNEVLARLLNFSRQGVPEAQNFSGFVYENGLLGARRDLRLARDYYMAAAAHRYQPAIFNLANMAYFGKGQSSDPEAARELIHQAVAIGPESSGRVCGLASFIEYRRGDQQAALRYGKFCYSALAHIPNAAYNTQLPLAQRIKMLRDSIGTGAPDGYRWLETITQRAGPDPAYLYCKYRVINQVRTNRTQTDIKALTRTCYENSTRPAGDKESDAAIKGIVSFVVTERRVLEQLQQTNRFHYSWSVPYLPFSQGDADLFEPVMKEMR